MSDSPVSDPHAPLLQQAQVAIKRGQKRQARQLLHDLLRRDPQNHRAWLLLASLTPSPQASLDYVKRAELLQPHDPTVQKARAWAERRLAQTAVSDPPALSQQRPWKTAVLWGGGILVAVLLLSLSIFYLRPDNAPEQSTQATIAESALSAPNGDFVAEAIAGNSAVSAAPTATQTPAPYVPAKNVAQNVGARATWTITPTPSPTPTPTPTYVPTFLSASNTAPRGRPFGVGPNERWIDVDLSRQSLTAYEGNEAVFSTLISSGTYDYPTVTGQFRIWLTFASQTMDGRLLGYDYYLEDVPYVMYFYEDYALHGTYWHNNFGTPMSHGCVNMKTSDAGWIYNWASVGTLVNVHY